MAHPSKKPPPAIFVLILSIHHISIPSALILLHNFLNPDSAALPPVPAADTKTNTNINTFFVVRPTQQMG